MNMNKKCSLKKLLPLCMLLLVQIPVPAQADKAATTAANRQTALRYLLLAKEYINDSDWDTAIAEAQLGLSYDATIADLWYVMAVAESNKGGVLRDILPYVTTALTESQWVDYNRDGARVLYADILSDTGKWRQAVAVLDTAPFLYSADAEYIRIQAYYRMHTADSIEKAREKVDSVRRIYPDDTRFPLIFFKYEYGYHLSETSLSEALAAAFITHMPQYRTVSSELAVYMATFAKDSEEQKRMLQSFSAKNMRHPLYAIVALKAGILDQQAAYDYFCSFADKKISVSYLSEFAPLITDNEVKKQFVQYLTAYAGTLVEDTNGDLEPNLVIKYRRGRPEAITWDQNSDGVNEWEAVCDFGVPVSIDLPEDHIHSVYGTYPFLRTAVFSDENGRPLVTFNLLDETLRWIPFSVKTSLFLSRTPGCDFYIPEVQHDVPHLSDADLLAAASSYEVPLQEYEGAFVKFSILDGIPQSSAYYKNGSCYARCRFKDGIPDVRTVDADGDGIFETTETYGFDPQNLMHRTAAENMQCMMNLFGRPEYGNGIYVKMIQVDTDKDNIADFSEEYLADDAKITSWDSNNDGLWDIRYVRYPENKNGEIPAAIYFYLMPERKLVSVALIDDKPVTITSDKTIYTVVKGHMQDFYWIGVPGPEEMEQKIGEAVGRAGSQGIRVSVDAPPDQFTAVQVDNKIFARLIGGTTESEQSSAEESAKTENK